MGETPPRRVSRRSRTLLVVAGLVVAAGMGLLVASSSKPGKGVAAAAVRVGGGAALPPPPVGFAIPKPRPLGDAADVSRWAPVLAATRAHERPSFDSPVVVRVDRLTPEGTTNLVVADGEVTRDGSTWVHARLAVLPDARTGWLPRSSLGGWSFVNTRVVVDRAHLTLTLYRNAAPVLRVPVGVGTSRTPTPAGRFYVRDRLTAYVSPEYGPLAFGTSARSPHETDWPAGGFIGIHGTDQPGLIPGRISHGCIRLTNSAIRALGRLMPVGTPVRIQ